MNILFIYLSYIFNGHSNLYSLYSNRLLYYNFPYVKKSMRKLPSIAFREPVAPPWNGSWLQEGDKWRHGLEG